MKKYNIHLYNRECPLAYAIENAVNNCNARKTHLENISAILGGEDRLSQFFTACLLYWAEAKHYDDRNRNAVLISREIVAKFTVLKKTTVCEELLKEAFAFTMFAHRHLQQTLFGVILYNFKQTGEHKLHQWYTEQEFVIDPAQDKATPYQEYRRSRL